MQIWPYFLILSASLSTFFVVRIIFYFNEKAAHLMTSSSVMTDQESPPALQLNWKILGDKKFALIHKSFTTNEARDC